MGLSLEPAIQGSRVNARFLAAACDLAYYNAPKGAEEFQTKLGLDAQLVSVDNTQAYVGTNADAIVVAFRGSESPTSIDGLKDWLVTNANNFLILPEGRIGVDFAAAGVGARFHRGFMEALAEIWTPLFAAVDGALKQQERPLFITGHSLGGALALLSAWRFVQNFVSVFEVVTFGAPMVGNATAAQAFEREFAGKVFRYVDDRDLVPRLPTISMIANEYGHCPNEMVLGSEGSALAALKEIGAKAVGGILSLSLMDQLWSLVQSRIESHLMGNYQARIE